MGDEVGASAAFSNLGFVSLQAGDLDRARAELEEGMRASRARGDRYYALIWGPTLAGLVWARGDLDAARALFAEWASNARGPRDKRSLALALHLCAEVATDGGDAATARAYYARALAIARGLGAELGAKPHWAASSRALP